MTCEHNAFETTTKVARLTDDKTGELRSVVAEISIRCTECDTPFRFAGVDTGYSFKRPMVDVPATTLFAPIVAGERTLDEVKAAGSLTYEVS